MLRKVDASAIGVLLPDGRIGRPLSAARASRRPVFLCSTAAHRPLSHLCILLPAHGALGNPTILRPIACADVERITLVRYQRRVWEASVAFVISLLVGYSPVLWDILPLDPKNPALRRIIHLIHFYHLRPAFSPITGTFLILMLPLSTPDRTFLTTAPSGTVLERPIDLTPDHPAALTFCVLGPLMDPVVLVSPSPHLLIYHGLQKCLQEPDPRRWKTHLREYSTKITHGQLTAERLEQFQYDSTVAHGFPRYRVLSGRLWSPLKLAGLGTVSALALWLDRKGSPEADCLMPLGRLLNWRHPVWIAANPDGFWQTS